MTSARGGGAAAWWLTVVIGAAVALLFAWLGRVAGVAPGTLLSIGAAVAALAWLLVLVTVPWNLYFAARQIVVEMAMSRGRGIAVRPEQTEEAERIARRMVRFAVGAHMFTAAMTALAAHVSGVLVGYYVAGFYLLSTALRPAGAYFAHLRQRISALGRETTHPRDDVVTLRHKVDDVEAALKEFRIETGESLRSNADAARRSGSDLAHLRQQVDRDLARLVDAQAADRAAARSGDEELRRTIDQMVRRVEAALDGVSDHQELLTGLRALVRMIRSDAAPS
jgi:hypothetical protein